MAAAMSLFTFADSVVTCSARDSSAAVLTLDSSLIAASISLFTFAERVVTCSVSAEFSVTLTLDSSRIKARTCFFSLSNSAIKPSVRWDCIRSPSIRALCSVQAPASFD